MVFREEKPVETVRTTCNRDCPDACSILVDKEGDRAVRLRGDPDHPITRGFLCARTNRFLERQYSPDRVTTPLVRRDGELRPASWDEALDRAVAGFARAREADATKSFGMFSCSKATNEMNYAAQKFVRAVMGSNNIDSCNRT